MFYKKTLIFTKIRRMNGFLLLFKECTYNIIVIKFHSEFFLREQSYSIFAFCPTERAKLLIPCFIL